MDGRDFKICGLQKIQKRPDEFTAFITEANDKTKIGEIKFEVALNKGIYEGKYYTNAYTSRYVKVSLGKDNSMLSVWGGITWGRLKDKDTPLYNPVLPVFTKIDDKTSLFSIPSFLIEAKDFNKVLIDNEKILRNTENLIIDIRGNTGGNAIYFPLIAAYYEKPLMNEVGYAVSSEDNLTYFKNYSTGKGNDPYKLLVENMKTGAGKIIDGPVFANMELKSEKTALKRVVIVTDKSNMSAAESFVLHSKAVSSKVTIMGENTGGVIDYNNINMVSLNCEKHGIFFGYPTFTFNKTILTNGYNKTGILPDIKIDNKVQDKIKFVTEYLQKS
ncbi:MAG: hypothetical protein HC867_07050 [Bacteroidia bacterium]|nr:hypothetical protein [Bacteroidia bacterium]